MKDSNLKRNQKRPAAEIKRFPGIAADARKLGVTRPHLWMCLVGQRVSARLTRRYQELKAEQKGAGK